MTTHRPSCPLSVPEVLDHYFLEHRAKLVDVAAFLDRVDRARAASSCESTDPEDFRLTAFRHVLTILADGHGLRAKRVLEWLSDPTLTPDPTNTAKTAVGAFGAPHRPGSDRVDETRGLP